LIQWQMSTGKLDVGSDFGSIKDTRERSLD